MNDLAKSVRYNTGLSKLEKVLKRLARPGEYFASGNMVFPLPKLEINGVGVISFPLPPAQAREIAGCATQAPYGRGEETVTDTSVRKVWQLGLDQFRLGGAAWAETLKTIVARSAETLGCESGTVTAEPYKLLLYEPGGFFLSHRDTEKVPGMFGTLVIMLPSSHEGGELVIRHAGREAVVDFSAGDVAELGYAAFYADCQHEVKPITNGNRLCLVYNLVHQGKAGAVPPTAPENSAAIRAAATLLAEGLRGAGAPPKIAYLLEHQYTPAGLSFAGLKNHDRAVAAVLAEASAEAGCVVYLGIVHIEESGVAEMISTRGRWGRYGEQSSAGPGGYEAVEVYESAQYISDWASQNGEPAPGDAIPLGEEELLPAGALDHAKPDEDGATEATGNEGATFERSYQRAAVVFWRRDRHAEVLLQKGVDAVMPYFKELVGSGRESSETIGVIAKAIVERWTSGARGFRAYQTLPEDRAKRAEMLQLLRRIGDTKILANFIEGVVVDDYDGSENAGLAAWSAELDPAQIRPALTDIFQKHISSRPNACLDLFARMARDSRVKHAGLPPSAAALFPALSKAFGQIKAPPAADANYWIQPEPELVKPGPLAALFQSMQSAGEEVSSALAKAVAANPAGFPPDDLLPAALTELAADQPIASQPALSQLWHHAAVFLLARSEHPPARPGDWARPVKLDCKCADCRELERFATDPIAQVHRFAVRQDRRHHLEGMIQSKRLDMSCETDPRGRPQSLVCTKNLASYERECARHRKHLASMKKLLALSVENNAEASALNRRMREATGRRGAAEA